jgi:hypothetical protein
MTLSKPPRLGPGGYTQPPPLTVVRYTPPGLSATSPEARDAVQQMADATRAGVRMNDGISAALAFADRYADHHAPLLFDAIRGTQYTLDRFLDFALGESADFAGDHLGPDATLAVVVPMWVHTRVQAPRTGAAYLTIPAALQLPYGEIWRLYVLAAADRTPSLLTMSWDWCGVYPCITPDEWNRQRERTDAGQAAA